MVLFLFLSMSGIFLKSEFPLFSNFLDADMRAVVTLEFKQILLEKTTTKRCTLND